MDLLCVNDEKSKGGSNEIGLPPSPMQLPNKNYLSHDLHEHAAPQQLMRLIR